MKLNRKQLYAFCMLKKELQSLQIGHPNEDIDEHIQFVSEVLKTKEIGVKNNEERLNRFIMFLGETNKFFARLNRNDKKHKRLIESEVILSNLRKLYYES